MSLPLSGNFSETPFTDIITVLGLQKTTGALVCVIAGAEKKVFVKDGQIIFASSSDERDRLGETMVRIGMIDRAQLKKALDAHKKASGLKKIGAICVELGYVAPKDLFAALKQQVRNILHDLFKVEEGAYHFIDDLPPDVIPLQIDIEELLREVIQQMKEGS